MDVVGELSGLDIEPRELSDLELEDRVRRCGRLRARLDAAEVRLLAELVRRRGTRSVSGLLREDTHVSSRAARARCDVAGVLARVPEAADALASGDITGEHAEHLARAARAHELDDRLLDAARSQPADEFANTARAWVNEHDRDGGAVRAERQRAKRKANLFTCEGDGMVVLHAELDPESGAVVRSALAAETDRLWRQEHGRKPVRARSTPEQRRADALVVLAAPGGETRPGPMRASVLVTVGYDALTGQLTGGHLSDGSPLTPEAARRLSCDAGLLPMVLDGASQPLDLGRDRRLPSTGLRRAVIERDRSCICGCGTPPEWCQIHHIIHWSRWGPTNLDNLVLVCSDAHHRLHEGRWGVIRTDAGFAMHPP